jgi:hypothetical protein
MINLEEIKIGYKEKPRLNYSGNAYEGLNYKSNLEIKDIAKLIKQQLKLKYPSADFSITKESYSGGQSLHIYYMKDTKSPYKTIENIIKDDADNLYYYCFTAEEKQNRLNYLKNKIDNLDYSDINHYHIKDDYMLTDYAKKILTYAKDLANSFNYDDSDSQTDYFSTNFYLSLYVGKWNKKFEIIK